jgi:hypothetical protein
MYFTKPVQICNNPSSELIFMDYWLSTSDRNGFCFLLRDRTQNFISCLIKYEHLAIEDVATRISEIYISNMKNVKVKIQFWTLLEPVTRQNKEDSHIIHSVIYEFTLK